MQTFTAPLNTNYKIECWGAQGGNSYEDHSYGDYLVPVYGGKGGYSSGEISFPTSLSIYIYVGQSGEGIHLEKTYNGGGAGGINYDAKSGGGATDIRLIKGNTWSEFNSLKSRIIVAAGGGGAQHFDEGCDGGNAGGLLGQDGSVYCRPNYNGEHQVATGGTQILGGLAGIGDRTTAIVHDGTFGIGGDYATFTIYNGSGGGGGYYGGGGPGYASDAVFSGAGGSSFISGYTGCNAISSSSTSSSIAHTGQPNHYSGYVFTNSVMIDGGSVMPSPIGGTETGHSGNGYCIISWISPSL